MDIRQLSDDVQVSGQVAPADMPALAAHGIRALVCNRPDGEAPDQPGFAEVAAAAERAGIAARYLPIGHGAMGEAEIAAFSALLAELPAPVLAYCRSGARSAALWSAARATATA